MIFVWFYIKIELVSFFRILNILNTSFNILQNSDLKTIDKSDESDEWDNDDERGKSAVDKLDSEGNKECREDEVRN